VNIWLKTKEVLKEYSSPTNESHQPRVVSDLYGFLSSMERRRRSQNDRLIQVQWKWTM